jgi:outer membrane usher protein FimD/PapC
MAPQRRHISYSDPLDEAAQEWRRVRIWLEEGRVRRFVVQYETTINGRRVPVVRYDTAHGVPHRDELFRDRPPVKTQLPPHLTLEEALQIADEDIRRNWRTYRQQF